MFQNLQERLESAFKNIKGQARITDLNVANTIKDIRRALLDADVNFKIAKEFTDKVKEKAIGSKVMNAINPSQLMVKIVQDELTELMGGEPAEFNITGNPAVVLVAGLQGSGKTTFTGKLATYLKLQKNKNVLVVAADIYRPAAIEQLQTLGARLGENVFVYSEGQGVSPVQICRRGLAKAIAEGYDTVIVDTAGRQVVDENLMDELKQIKAAINPDETLLVVDAMTGQEAATLTAK